MLELKRGTRATIAVCAAASLAVTAMTAPASAQRTSRWKTATSGNWADGFRWSTDPIYPNNGTPPDETYHVVIDPTGIMFSVGLDRDIVVDSVLLDSTGSIHHTAGTFRSHNGIELRRGSWRVSGGAAVESDVRVVKSAAGLVLENGSGFNGTITLEGAASLSFGADQTFSGPAQVMLNDAPDESQSSHVYGHNLTIGSQVTVVTGTGNGQIGKTTDALTNEGRITAANGQTIRLMGRPLTNRGTIEAIDGSRVLLELGGASANTGTIRAASGSEIYFALSGGTWTNTGAFHLDDATLVLDGFGISPAMTVGLTRSGDARVVVGGPVENAGSALPLDAFSGRWTLGRGRTTTGEIKGGSLGFPNESGTLSVVGDSQLTDVTNEVHVDIQPGVTLTLAGNTINNGRITASGATVAVTGNPSSLGKMSITDSTLQLGSTSLTPPVTNIATNQLSQITFTGSKIVLARGATIDNTGGTIHTGADPAWHFAGGTVNNGTIVASPGGEVLAVREKTVLENVAITGPLAFEKGQLILRNGSTWNGTKLSFRSSSDTPMMNPGLQLPGPVVLDNPVEVVLEGAKAVGFIEAPAGSITIASDLHIDGENGAGQAFGIHSSTGPLVNRGRILIEGAFTTLDGASISNEGLIEVRDGGSLNLSRSPTNYVNGTLTGGRWHVSGGGSLMLTRGHLSRITTNAAEIVVDGPTTTLRNYPVNAPLMLLSRNEGSLSILGGHVLNTFAELTNVGYIKVGRGSVLTASGLIDSTDATLDTDGLLIVTATDATRAAVLDDVTRQIRAARNSPEGRWRGKGITSAAAMADALTGLAAVINDNGSGSPIISTRFGSVTPDQNSIIIRHTYNGDANIDGLINADDYFRIDSGFLAQPPDPTYRDGDFNYDTVINADDYFLIDSAFLGQGDPIVIGASLTGAVVAVPEPSLASLLAAAGTLGLCHRRRRR